MSLTRLIYRSQNVNPAAAIDIENILASARKHNARNGITGVLLFNHNFFVQALEGQGAKVSETFLRICHDRRHKDVTLVGMVTIQQRRYPDWDMRYISDISSHRTLFQRHSTTDKFNPTPMDFAQLDELLFDVSHLQVA